MGGVRTFHDSDDSDLVPNEPLHSLNTLNKDEENGAIDAVLPPPDGGGDDIGDLVAISLTRSRTSRARTFLAIGLVLEVSSTLWAYRKAALAGAFDATVDCTEDGEFSKLYISSLVLDVCDGPIDAEAFYNYTGSPDKRYSSLWDDHAVCDSPNDAPTGEDSFEERCSCLSPAFTSTPCSWVALSRPPDDTCYAESMETEDGTVTGPPPTPFGQESGLECWATKPSGTAGLTIISFVVALSRQLLEAVVGFKYWRDADSILTPCSTLATLIFDIFGVPIVSLVLICVPGTSRKEPPNTPVRIPVFFTLAWATVAILFAGVVARLTVASSPRLVWRWPYLGAVGHGLAWLSTALIEVVVTSYVVWTGPGMQSFSKVMREAAGLLAFELMALVAMCIAHGFWARAQLFMRERVSIPEVPQRRGTRSTVLK